MATKKKRERRSWGKIRKLASSGRYQASYIGPDLVRHLAPHTFTAKIDAEGWLIDERRLIEQSAWTPPSQRATANAVQAATVADYAQQWIDHKTKLKPRTRSGYQSLLDNHIADTIGTVPMQSLTPQAVRAWFAGLGEKYQRRNSHAYGLLHAVCATAVTDGLLPSNPCNIPKVMNPPTVRQPVILETSEVAALADEMPEHLKALVLVLAWCAPRWGEAAELRRRDLNADCSVLTIERAVTHRDKQCSVGSPKSGKGRKVVVPPHIRPALLNHLKKHVAKGADALLFSPVNGGCHLNDKVFRDSYYMPALAKIGRDGEKKPRPTIHDLRHFAGTQTARVGNTVETMQRLGHSTVKASLIYQQIVHGRDAEVADALSKLAET